MALASALIAVITGPSNAFLDFAALHNLSTTAGLSKALSSFRDLTPDY